MKTLMHLLMGGSYSFTPKPSRRRATSLFHATKHFLRHTGADDAHNPARAPRVWPPRSEELPKDSELKR